MVHFQQGRVLDPTLAKEGRFKLSNDTYYRCLMTNFLRKVDSVIEKLEHGDMPNNYDLTLLRRYRDKVKRTFKVKD